MFSKLFHSSLSPNVTRRDINVVVKTLLNIPQWIFPLRHSTQQLEKIHRFFQNMFHVDTALSFDSGRSALYALLQSSGMQRRDYVVLQAFTCTVVPNAIIAAGGTPLYVDIDESYNIDVKKLKVLLETMPHVRAVIVQHTFGQPADIHAITALCRARGVRVIEDCAHALGARVDGKLVGTFGDAAMFSFGRDKVISTVSGGVAITNDSQWGEALRKFYTQLPFPNRRWTLQRLFHPLIFAIAKPLYSVAGIGKIMIAGARVLRLFPEVLSREEKKGCHLVSRRYAPLLVPWLSVQLQQYEAMNAHRRAHALHYRKKCEKLIRDAGWKFPIMHHGTTPVFLRCAVQISRSAELLRAGKQKYIFFGDWYRSVITPAVDTSLLHYRMGTCPVAEQVSQHVVNLPLTPTMSLDDIDCVINFCQQFYRL